MTKTRRGQWRSCAKRGGAARTTRASTRGDGGVDRVPRRYGPKERRSGGARVGGDGGEDLEAATLTACRGAMARRGDAAATCGSGSRGNGLGAAAWTARRGAVARRGDTVATRKSGQPPGEPRRGGVAAQRGDTAAARCSIGG